MKKKKTLMELIDIIENDFEHLFVYPGSLKPQSERNIIPVGSRSCYSMLSPDCLLQPMMLEMASTLTFIRNLSLDEINSWGLRDLPNTFVK